jgi:hypothetical protein
MILPQVGRRPLSHAAGFRISERGKNMLGTWRPIRGGLGKSAPRSRQRRSNSLAGANGLRGPSVWIDDQTSHWTHCPLAAQCTSVSFSKSVMLQSCLSCEYRATKAWHLMPYRSVPCQLVIESFRGRPMRVFGQQSLRMNTRQRQALTPGLCRRASSPKFSRLRVGLHLCCIRARSRIAAQGEQCSL